MSNISTTENNFLQKRNQIKALLENFIATVVFTKKDGTERLMKCTLKEDQIIIPAKNTGINKTEEVLSVWDVEVNAWRSFRVDSVKEVRLV